MEAICLCYFLNGFRNVVFITHKNFGVVIDHVKLQIPHPRMSLRKFVLKPMVDIAPNWVHELLDVTLNDLLLQCEDQSEIKLYGTLSLYSS